MANNLICLDQGGRDPCSGETVLRESLSGTGTPIARCDHHWNQRLEMQDEINQRYPVMQPDDFDPAYAGESWYEDE